MKPTQTGIAVALALAVVASMYFFPGLLFPQPSVQSEQATGTITDTNQTAAATMPTENPNDLQITDPVIGTGETAAAGDIVTVNYVGALTNGTVFDASANHGKEGFTFPLGAKQVIEGWDKGIVGMKVGGKRHLVIPAALAYGDRAVGDVIPANSTLIFDVELLKVQKVGR